jgi:hypothetical protein
MFDAVLEELRKGDAPLNASEVVQALRSLTYEEVEEIVDAAMRSPEGARALADQSAADREAIRRQLLRLPIDFEQIRTRTEAHERATAEQLKDATALEIRQLEKALRRHLLDRKYYSAYRATRRIQKLDRGHVEANRTESWLRERGRMWRHWRFAHVGGVASSCLGAACGAGVIAQGALPVEQGVLLMLLMAGTCGVGGTLAGYLFGRLWGGVDDAVSVIVSGHEHRRGG